MFEGESDCWTAWLHELPAIGIPGHASTGAIEPGHLRGVRSVHVLVEDENLRTYPDGVQAYIDGIRSRLADLGFDGAVLTARPPEPYEDFSDAFQHLGAAFPDAVAKMLDQSVEGRD